MVLIIKELLRYVLHILGSSPEDNVVTGIGEDNSVIERCVSKFILDQ